MLRNAVQATFVGHVIEAMKQHELRLTMTRIIEGVHVERDPRGSLVKRLEELVHHHVAQPLEVRDRDHFAPCARGRPNRDSVD